MSFVLDASVTGLWCFPDESNPAADGVLDQLRRRGATAPWIWWFEIRNLLIIGERRGRIGADGTAIFLRDLADLPIWIDQDPDEAPILRLARQHRLTVYDAAYLELAARLGQPLATLDDRLSAAAERAGIPLLSPGPA